MWVPSSQERIAARAATQTAVSAYELENLVTALVPSDTACLESSPGSMRRTDVWISRDESVAFLEKRHSLEASRAMRSKMSLMNEFMIDMPFLEMPVSGCTCLSTR